MNIHQTEEAVGERPRLRPEPRFSETQSRGVDRVYLQSAVHVVVERARGRLFLHLPVFPGEPRNTRELVHVVRDEREPARHRDGSDLEVVRSNSLPSSFKGVADVRVPICRGVVERQRHHRREKGLDDRALLNGITAPRGPVKKLGSNDRASRNVAWNKSPQACNDWRGFLAETGDANVRIEQVSHGSKGGRTVASGCGGRSKVGSWMAPSTASNHPSGQLVLVSSRTINSTRCPTSGASSGRSTVVELRVLWIRMALIAFKIPRRLKRGDRLSSRNASDQMISVGRPGLEPGTYGLKVRSSTD